MSKMLKKYAKYDFRLDEDADWLLKNRPLEVDWGFDWFHGSDITAKHFPVDDPNYRWLIIASRSGNASAQVELLTELGEWMGPAVVGVAISEDDMTFVVIVDGCEAEWEASDPGHDSLTNFVRAARLTTKYRLPPGHIPFRMDWEVGSPLDDWGIERVPKAWN
jgi:hypothetical protein